MKVRKAWVAQGFLGVAFLLWSAPVWAQLEYGPWSINGVYQYEIYGSTGHANPNNRGFPGSRGLQNEPGKPDFQLMQQTAELRIYGNLSENWSVYMQPRFWHDLTKSVDDHYIQYESLPHNFRGDGWMLRGGGNDGKAELWQAYVDYRTENLWVRAGKQSIAWGEDLALRILDQVDSLDLSQIFFFGRAFEEFERQRTPEWMLRVNYNIKNRLIPDLTLETLVSPGTWTPNILPEQGAPFNVVPAILAYRELTSMGRPIWGGRLIGSIGAAQFSLNVLSRPSSAGIALTDGIFPSVHGGVPLLAPLGDLTLYRVRASARHPRFYLFGGSLNYPWEWAGAVVRFETAVVPDSPFTNPSFQHIIERPVWQIFASVDRPTYLIPKLDSMFINMQFLETYTFGCLHGDPVLTWSWTLAGRKPMLMPSPRNTGMFDPNPDPYTFVESPAKFPKMIWELRPEMFLVDGVPHLEGANYSKKRMYVDGITGLVESADVWDLAGKLWKFMTFPVANRGVPDGAGGTARSSCGIVFADLQKDYHSCVYFPAKRGNEVWRCNTGLKIDDWLTPLAMLKRSRR